MPLDSRLYVVRPVDEQFRAALARRDSIVLVKGARQMGKTSLLARGLQHAREEGARVVFTDLERLGAVDLESADALFRRLAGSIADQIDLGVDAEHSWHPRRSAAENFERFWRRQVLGRWSDGAAEGSDGAAEGSDGVMECWSSGAAEGSDGVVEYRSDGADRHGSPLLQTSTTPALHRSSTPSLPPAACLVWGLDEVDRLFTRPFASEVFGLFRSWHNARAFDPAGPWSRLTLAIAYATEAHLFIPDPNQSPFNVGTRLELGDFSLEQVAELNVRHGAPLRNGAEIERFYGLLGGHPYLVRRGLHELAERGLAVSAIEAEEGRDEGIFGDHLRRLLALLRPDPELCEVVRAALGAERGPERPPAPSAEAFYRLRSAGILAGESAQEACLRCRLYAGYLRRHLR